MALEGNEVEGKLGSAGDYKVDVKDDGTARVELSVAGKGLSGGLFVDLDIIEALRPLVERTANGIDNAMLNALAKAFGRQ